MIGRADIEGSKSSVAMSGLAATSQLSLCRIPLVVPVLSWLFGAGKLERAVPSPSPADTRRSLATLAAQAAANSRRVELGPRAQPSSQSFSKGCSPWRPDAVMSATGRGGFRSSVFKGAGMHGHHAACGALPAAGPYLRLSRFRSGQAVSAQLGTVTRLRFIPHRQLRLPKMAHLELDSVGWLNKAATRPTYLKFENRSRALRPDASNHWLYPIELRFELRLSEETGGTSY
ncbi:hypothetical protein Bca101_101355 [Brassica carinata]